MMRILIDATCILPTQSGVGRYAIELLRAMLPITGEHHVHVLIHTEMIGVQNPSLDFLLNSHEKNFEISYLEVPGIGLKREWLFLKNQSSFPAHDVFHCLSSNAPRCMATKGLVTIHDLKFILFPRFFGRIGWLKSLFLRIQFAAIAKNYQAIITVSESTRQDFIGIYKDKSAGLSSRVKAIHSGYTTPNGSTTLAELHRRYGFSSPYVFYIGELRPHKNVRGMIDAFLCYKKEHPRDEVVFVVGGKVHPSFVKDFEQNSSIKFIGFVQEEDLGPLYQYSIACYFASLYEGFGFPILEAMAVRTIVITSSVSSMPEVAGGAALLVDPLSQEEMKQALTCVAQMSGEERESVLKKGDANLERFSWEICAHQTFSQYSHLATAKTWVKNEKE